MDAAEKRRQLKEIVEETDSLCRVVMKAARLFGCKPHRIATKVVVDVREEDGQVIETYAGTLTTPGEGIVFFDAQVPRADIMMAIPDGEGFRFDSLSNSTFRWRGRMVGNEIRLDRDRDTYMKFDLPERHAEEIRAWLQRYAYCANRAIEAVVSQAGQEAEVER